VATESQSPVPPAGSASGLLTLDAAGESGDAGESGELDEQAAASVAAATMQTAAAPAPKNRVRVIMAVHPCSPR
jgi:hypothetical protein